jgi:hypothetical protein
VTGRGVEVRRVRVVSEPVSDYIKFEHATTPSSIAAGEQIRWLPRHLATGLLFPANDFWVFDGRQAQFNYFRAGASSWRLASHPIRRSPHGARRRSRPHGSGAFRTRSTT